MKRLICLMAIGLSFSANATDWFDLGKSENNNLQIFIDLDSVYPYRGEVVGGSTFKTYNTPGQYIQAVFQLTYINNHPLREYGYYYSTDLFVISCIDSTQILKASVDYGFKDEVIDTYNKTTIYNSDFKFVFPDTVGGGMTDFACELYELMQ